MLIDPNEVRSVFEDSLMTEEDMEATFKETGDFPATVTVEGLVRTVVFDAGRLEKNRDKVINLLRGLPDEFARNKGGGWSFLNACQDRDGELWSGFHRDAEALLMLGMGLNLCGRLGPREMDSALPGGVPYFVTDLPEVANEPANP